MSSAASLQSVQVGVIAPLGPRAVPSGFVKTPVSGPVRVGRLGLEGDSQADLTVHGGAEKAVYAYAAAHYPRWLRDFPQHVDRLGPGAFGENLTVIGLEESDLCVGDVHRVGSTLLQVCQPRQPCFKFALRFEDERMPRAMVQNGRAGWYYRVLEEGVLQPGDPVRLTDRPNPGLSFVRLIDIIYRRAVTRGELLAMAGASGIAAQLRERALRRLAAEPSAQGAGEAS